MFAHIGLKDGLLICCYLISKPQRLIDNLLGMDLAQLT